jgi:hypothetical protein
VRHSCIRSAVILLSSIAFTSLAHAQATRTWVSGVGDDVNPCSRTAPCKTFAGAISKTAAGGEINALDPGGYGAVTITKAITIDGGGMLASIINAGGTNGIIVAAGSGDTVILRNLDIQGVGSGLNGIKYNSGGRLVVDNVSIAGINAADPNGNGIFVSLTSPTGDLVVRNSHIVGGRRGVYIQGPAGGFAEVTLDNVTITGAVIAGVDAGVGFSPAFGFSSSTTIARSLITQSGVIGAQVQVGEMNIDGSTFSQNAIGAQAAPGATLRISGNGFYSNGAAFGCGGTLASDGANRKGGSSGGCNPNAAITVQ